MIEIVRRFLVIAALMFWQGGFVFYAGVVVPIGTDVLGSAADQARITRQVTRDLNLAGAVALALVGLDLLAARRRDPAHWGRWITAALMLAALLALMVLHPRLDRMFHGEEAFLDDRAAFKPWHRLYLWISTIQWFAAVVFTFLTLLDWRSHDRRSPTH